MKIESKPNVKSEFFLDVAQYWTATPFPERTGVLAKDDACTVSASSPQEALALAIVASSKISNNQRLLIEPSARPTNMLGENGTFLAWNQPKGWLIGHRGF